MAGFFGLLNYEKPGPGVNKHEPKKKGFALFFNILVQKFWQLISLSLLAVLVSLPVLTMGLADVGVAYVTRNFAREKPVLLKDDFFGAIKKNWKQALPVGIVNLLITVVLGFDLWFFFAGWEHDWFYKIGFVVSGIIFIVFSFLRYYINMLIVTFDLSFKQLYKNSLLLSSAGIKQNLIITAMLLVLYAVLFLLPFVFSSHLYALLGLVIAVLLLPALRGLIIQFWVFPVVKKQMIDPYYKAHPEAKKDKRLLNLDDEDEGESAEKESGEEDTLFRDVGSAEQAAAKEQTHIPKQYSKKELKRQRRRDQSDDDDTI